MPISLALKSLKLDMRLKVNATRKNMFSHRLSSFFSITVLERLKNCPVFLQGQFGPCSCPRC